MMKEIIKIVIFILPFCSAYSQINMVINGSFENNTAACLQPYLTGVHDWQGLSGTADFYSWTIPCSPSFNAVPPSSGSGGNCIGFLFSGPREYPNGKLDCPMIKDKCYKVKFKYRADELVQGGGGWFSNNLGVLFSNTVPNHTPNSWQPIITTPSLNISTIIYPGTWHEFEGYYTSVTGGEKYITIGNFYSQANTQTVKGPFGSSGAQAYIFIDAVEVYAIEDDDKYIENTVYANATNHTIEAGNAIFAGYAVDMNASNNGNVTVNNGANVTYRAGRKIVLESGFKANNYFHAYISPFCNNDYSDITVNAGEDISLYYQDASCPSVGDVCYQAGETPNPNFSYSWSPQGGLSNPAVSDPMVCYDPNLQYPVTYVVTKTNGCLTVYDTITVSMGTPSPGQMGWHPGTCSYTIYPNFGVPPYTYLWNTGSTSSSASTSTFPADFTVVITDANGLKQKVCVLDACPGGFRLMPENNNPGFKGDVNLSISPNPNNGIFNIDVGEISSETLIEVYDVMGKLVLSTNISNTKQQIDISNQPKGIYLVKVTIGDKVYNEKIVYQ